jgi:XTP/dITP diphosphohydrolase
LVSGLTDLFKGESMKILIATHNPGKIKEMSDVLQAEGHETVSLSDLGITQDIAEDEKTFAGNAMKKARFFGELTDLPAIADDGGLEIPAFNGEPGVRTRRWDGSAHMDDERLLVYTLEKMRGISDRRARLIASIVFADIDGGGMFCQEEIEGTITEEALAPIMPGYPFRSIFIVKEFNKLFADLTPEEHALINPRRKATAIIAKLINRKIN